MAGTGVSRRRVLGAAPWAGLRPVVTPCDAGMLAVRRSTPRPGAWAARLSLSNEYFPLMLAPCIGQTDDMSGYRDNRDGRHVVCRPHKVPRGP